jgi:anti-sigma B factor antagonist
LQIKARQSGDITILDLDGHLVMGPECQLLERTIRQLVQENQTRVLLNAECLSYIDSSGLGELVASLTQVKQHAGTLKLVQATDLIRELLHATRMQKVLELYDCETEALASFAE